MERDFSISGQGFMMRKVGRFITADTYTNLPNDERILSNKFSLDEKYKFLLQGITHPQSQNRYSYCYNNPINNTDPDGHFAPLAIAGIYVAPSVVTAVTVAARVLTGYIGALIHNEVKSNSKSKGNTSDLPSQGTVSEVPDAPPVDAGKQENMLKDTLIMIQIKPNG